VGFVGSATYALLPRLLPAFRARYPQVELVLRESANLELLAMVESGDLDVGLVRYPTGSASSLLFEIVERDVFCAVLPSAHVLAAKERLTLHELAREQRRADLFLQLADRHREWGLRHVEAQGGAAEVERFGHGDELVQLA